MFTFLDRLSRRVMRRGLRQGLVEGSAVWLVAGAVAWLARLIFTAEAPKVVSEQLKVGESIVVTHVAPPPTRRAQRRADRRAESIGEE